MVSATAGTLTEWLSELLQHARAVGALRVMLTTPSVNARGLAFYSSMGFSLSKTFTVHIHDDCLELSEMEHCITNQ